MIGRRAKYCLAGLSGIVLIVLISLLTTMVCSFYGLCVFQRPMESVSASEGLGVIGVIVTVVGLVAAFAIVVMAIDAFAISNTVGENARKVKASLESLEDIEARLDKAKLVLNAVSFVAREVDHACDEEGHVYAMIQRLARKVDFSDELKEQVLGGQQALRKRRARLGATRGVIAKLNDEEDTKDLSSAIVELQQYAQSGDQESQAVLDFLKSLGIDTSL